MPFSNKTILEEIRNSQRGLKPVEYQFKELLLSYETIYSRNPQLSCVSIHVEILSIMYYDFNSPPTVIVLYIGLDKLKHLEIQ